MIESREVYVYRYSVSNQDFRGVNFQQVVGNREDDTIVVDSKKASGQFKYVQPDKGCQPC